MTIIDRSGQKTNQPYLLHFYLLKCDVSEAKSSQLKGKIRWAYSLSVLKGWIFNPNHSVVLNKFNEARKKQKSTHAFDDQSVHCQQEKLLHVQTFNSK